MTIQIMKEITDKYTYM